MNPLNKDKKNKTWYYRY